MDHKVEVLTITNMAGDPKDNSRVTLSVGNINALSAFDDMKHDRLVKRVEVDFTNGSVMELFVTELDLLVMEKAVGAYSLEMYEY